MADFTTKLDLYLPGGGSSGTILPDENFDIDRINDNMRLIDSAVGYTICTSTTRPALPYPGQAIYETDTKDTYLYNPDIPNWVFLARGEPFRIAAGLAQPLALGTVYNVLFPVGKFTVPPLVMPGLVSASSASAGTTVFGTPPTVDGFSYRCDGGTFHAGLRVSWVAIQISLATAAG